MVSKRLLLYSCCLIAPQIFKVSRDGEYKRFRPFEQLHNRQLLWHGSRTTNYAGILSQGLRIAPPEAPVVSDVTLAAKSTVLAESALTI